MDVLSPTEARREHRARQHSSGTGIASTLVLLRAGTKLQLPRLTLHHNVDIACSALVGADAPSQSSAPSHRDSSGTLLRHSCCVIYYDSCACAAGRDHLAALNVRGRDASPM